MNYREMALFEAVKSHWTATGCPALVPAGVWWGKADNGTEPPYCIFDPLSSDRDFDSNKSAYRQAFLQFKILHGSRGEAGDLLDEVMNLLMGTPLALDPTEGFLWAWSRGSYRYAELEDGVYTAWCDAEVRRVNPR